jgi:hypothetical protein
VDKETIDSLYSGTKDIYKSFKIEMHFYLREINDGYQEIKLSNKNGTIYCDKSNYDLGGGDTVEQFQ